MSNNKVIWSEGMFLNPQHFQQQERYFERYIRGSLQIYSEYNWGLISYKFDEDLLKLGKISFSHASGVFPDGTPFSFPDNDKPPPVLEVAENKHNLTIYLGIPVKRAGATDVLPEQDAQGLARFYLTEQEVRDTSADEGEHLKIQLGQLRFRLLLQDEDMSGYICIAIARISESRQDKQIILDQKFLPDCFDCKANSILSGFLSELLGMLHYRGEAIAGRLADTGRGGTAEIADYMMLQMINRMEPLATHLSQRKQLHPMELYKFCIQLLGEISTFVAKKRRPPLFPDYNHDNQTEMFYPLMASLRDALNMVYEQTAISLSLVEKKFGIRVSEILDRSLLDTAIFIIAAKADMKEEKLRSNLPAQLKISPVERIRQLVNSALPGIGLKALPVAPRQIPYRSGFAYFELEKHSHFWRELNQSGGFAFHIGGDFPGLELEFWAIRQ